MSRISQYAPITNVASNVLLPVVDVNDTSMASTGTTKNMTMAQLPQAGPSQNVTPQNFSKWRAALGRVRSGSGTANILCIGDSTTEGDFISNVSQTWPSQLTGLLNSYYAPAAQTWAFWHSVTSGYDTRVTAGTGWTTGTLYGAGYWSSSTNGATLSYAPSSAANGPASTDTCTIYFSQVTGHGTFTVNVDGGSTLATVNTGTGGSVVVNSVTVTYTAGSSHTINCVVTGGTGTVYIIGFNSYLSTATNIRVGNAAIGGSRAQDWQNTSAAYYYGNLPSLIQPDLIVVDLGINDASTYTTAQYVANMQIILTNCINSGASILVKSMVPSELNTGLVPQETAYAAALPALAQSNNCGFLDGFDRWQSWAIGNALGMYANNEHPSGTGAADIAQAVFQVISRV